MNIYLTINDVRSRSTSRYDIEQWGGRLLGCYEVYISLDGIDYCFKWVMAGDSVNKPCPEAYDEDDGYDLFLKSLWDKGRHSVMRPFMRRFEDAVCMAMHSVHSRGEEQTIDFPIVIKQAEQGAAPNP
ncbi:hypothetical protein HW115_19465 [Verrucomicrobiaceae bacterium N1E253]|uniref:Uncharacterized protein n=1 Tax=Oceaniferula marina TaxID=2748318 RepID=A0A851GRZ7_9BACT|nr:hypothetical protein [Oceaniferula marina]NWK57807.1 hypothetical protein [Oceaniferula marina]